MLGNCLDFDPEDFAAAYIAANKPENGGHLYVVKDHSNYDYDHIFVITCKSGRLNIEQES